ncbi:ABC transporter permease [Aquabacter spiritensis]|uniref:Peptide/nickel transport system permease protein n=1 Tax=Aquabacter spiritensis TaxID=933073 RepID=A0A4R3M6B7_9HYPH|nr:ABC transporter permease [Aquabacter spiritensis]TCT07809.1 peptide/nickel transport system permease protein [Aquabacter spiritensis]
MSMVDLPLAPRPVSALRIFARNRSAALAGLVLAALLLVALAAPLLAPYAPGAIGVGPAMVGPDAAHLFGTDELGRDVLSRVLYGLRISLLVGFGAAGIATALGIVMGGIAGFSGGLVDDLLMRVTEVFQVIPRFFLAVVLVAFFGASIWNIIGAIAILSWPDIARLVRAEFLTLRTRQFVDAARVAGAPAGVLIFGEILPNALAPVVVNGTLMVGQAMLLEAGLSYLGLGDPSQVSLGLILQEAQQIMRRAWWTTAFPGIAIFLAVLSLNVVGDGLNDVLNPRSRER